MTIQCQEQFVRTGYLVLYTHCQLHVYTYCWLSGSLYIWFYVYTSPTIQFYIIAGSLILCIHSSLPCCIDVCIARCQVLYTHVTGYSGFMYTYIYIGGYIWFYAYIADYLNKCIQCWQSGSMYTWLAILFYVYKLLAIQVFCIHIGGWLSSSMQTLLSIMFYTFMHCQLSASMYTR